MLRGRHMRIKRIFAGFLSAAMLFASVSVLAAKTDDDEKEIQEIQQIQLN